MASQDQYYRPGDENKGVTDSMKEKGREVKETTGQKAHETREKAGEMTESAKEKAYEGKEKTKGALQQTGDKVKHMAESAADTVKHAFGVGQRHPDDPTQRADDAYLGGTAAGDDITGTGATTGRPAGTR